MSNTLDRRRFQRQESIKNEKEQLMFTSGGGLKPNPNIVAVSHDFSLPMSKKISCPFCLGLSEFRLFLVSTKAGISRSMGHCPLCDQGMQLRSLVHMDKSTAKEYAGWVFRYRGFFKKIKFNEWKGRLKIMGWTQEFWDEYKRLKGEREKEGSGEDYGDMMNRLGQEEAARWNQEDRER